MVHWLQLVEYNFNKPWRVQNTDSVFQFFWHLLQNTFTDFFIWSPFAKLQQRYRQQINTLHNSGGDNTFQFLCKCYTRESNLAEVIRPEPFFNLFCIWRLHKTSAIDSRKVKQLPNNVLSTNVIISMKILCKCK